MAEQWKQEIQHVVLLMLENRSFDHMLGDLQQLKGVDGIDRTAPPRTNSYEGVTYPQVEGAGRMLAIDVDHERADVVIQLENENQGFVKDFAVANPLAVEQWGEIMKFHALDKLPALHALARKFLVCDHWFASVPGPTWPNRLFALSGTSLGRVKMPEGHFNWNLHWYNQPTLFDRLNEKNIPWKVYFGDFPLSFLFVHQLEPANALRHRKMAEFYEDVVGSEHNFPRFAFIEPAYFQPHADDDHPPHDILAGQTLVANVYNAIRHNEELWKRTLLVVLYDEHGGFYDHVLPPPANPPDHHTEEFAFDQLGVRVPAVLVSPWVRNGVLKDEFDHTSLLKFLVKFWSLNALGNRAAVANTFESAFLDAPRVDTPSSIAWTAPAVQVPVPRQEVLSGHQSALVSLSQAIESVAKEDANTIAARLRQSFTGVQSQADMAIERVESFIELAESTVTRKSWNPLLWLRSLVRRLRGLG